MKTSTILLFMGLLPIAAYAAPESAKEFEARYGRADADRSGGLSKQETERAAAPGFPVVLKNFDAMDANKDGQVTLAERNAALANAAKARQVQMQQRATQERKAWEDRFAKADINKDKALSKSEADKAEKPGFPQVTKNFTAMDKDKNGKVTVAERDDYLKGEARRQAEERQKQARKAFDERFSRADINKSGGLSKSEVENAAAPGFPVIKGNFETVDGDKNGQVSLGELDAYLKRKR